MTEQDWLRVEFLLGISDLDFDVYGNHAQGAQLRGELSHVMLLRLSNEVKRLEADNKRLRRLLGKQLVDEKVDTVE